MATTVRERIDGFLACHRLAIVGVSRSHGSLSRLLLKELTARGYDVVAVNPRAETIDGRPCLASVGDIDPPVEAALVMVPAAAAEQVVRDCAAAGIRQVWLHRGAGRGAVSREALAAAEELGLELVPGYCPFMFLPGSGGVHGLHRGLMRLCRTFPEPVEQR